MNTKVASVLMAWINLSLEEREEFRKIAAGYSSQPTDEQLSIREGLDQHTEYLNFGPVKDPCQYCGR